MIERILAFSLRNRLLVVLCACLVALAGADALRRLPIDAVPDITNNQVQVNTRAPGLSPVEMEKLVTYPLETALAGMPGLEYTRSLSRNGLSQITAVFRDEVDIYFARQQVGERLAQSREALPSGAEPQMGAVSTGLGEIYMWSVEFMHPGGAGAAIGPAGWQPDGSYLTPEGQRLVSQVELASYLRTVQDWVIKPQMKALPGVAGIDTIGGFAKEYHVLPQPEKLAALGLGFADVMQALARNNNSVGARYIEHNGESYVVRADGRFSGSEDIGNTVLARRGGIPLYVKDVAQVAVGRELRSGSASLGGREVVIGTALMRIGGNSRTVAAAVDEKLKAVNATLPPDIQVRTLLNRSVLVDRTIHTVQKNLAEGALLVIAVLFAMLGNIRAALITALVIPLSMLMTAMGMMRLGISANLMSLGALDFGLIVDGAVIITENCLRRLAESQHRAGRALTLPERLQQVMAASCDMIKPSLFGQAIIIMVYIPLLTFSGIEGKMFEPMAVTVMLALAAAFILSLTFVPAMIALCVTGAVAEKDSRPLTALRRRYAAWLERALRRPLPVAGAASGAFLAALALFLALGQEFIPTLDEKDIAMHALRIPSTSLSQSQALQLEVEKAVSEVPEVAFVFSKTGTAELAADPMPIHASDTFIILKDKSLWPDASLDKASVIGKIAQAAAAVPGNNYEFTQPIQMRFNELISGVRSDIAVKLFGDDFSVMESTAARIAQVLQALPGAADVKVEQVSGLPMLQAKLDKQAIARYGLNAADVLDTLAVAVGGGEAGVVFEGDRRYPVVVRLPEALRQDIRALEALPVLLPAEDPLIGDRKKDQLHARPAYIPLKQVAVLELADGPNQLSRDNGKRRVVVQANVRGRDIGSFVAQAQAAVAGLDIPPGYWLEWGGQFKNLQEAKSRLLLVVPACFLAILLLLYAALGSAPQALLVFTGVPMALTGGVVALWLRGMPFSISAAVGFIALSGVAVLNGLVLITRINQLICEGMPRDSAVREGALSRFRPVLMTALVASLGFLPMALATGAGAEVQKPLATVIIGGLVTATFLTLLVLPALYQRVVRR